jgi:hypothetical protein
MPGSVAAVSPSGVLPQSLCTAFTEVRSGEPLRISGYHDGSSQRSTQATTSRKRFRLTEKLPVSAVATLKSFYDSKRMSGAFYYYNPQEPAIGQPVGSNYDGSGASLTGRYAVVFRTPWSQSCGLARTQVAFEIEEVA